MTHHHIRAYLLLASLQAARGCFTQWPLKHALYEIKRNTFIIMPTIQNIDVRVYYVKGCGMGPWLVLVSPCFRENAVATCKIWYFL